MANGIPGSVTRNGFTGALASIDPATGQVRAIVGGPGFDQVKFDLATQGLRQPGFRLQGVHPAGRLRGGIRPE